MDKKRPNAGSESNSDDSSEDGNCPIESFYKGTNVLSYIARCILELKPQNMNPQSSDSFIFDENLSDCSYTRPSSSVGHIFTPDMVKQALENVYAQPHTVLTKPLTIQDSLLGCSYTKPHTVTSSDDSLPGCSYSLPEGNSSCNIMDNSFPGCSYTQLPAAPCSSPVNDRDSSSPDNSLYERFANFSYSLPAVDVTKSSPIEERDSNESFEIYQAPRSRTPPAEVLSQYEKMGAACSSYRNTATPKYTYFPNLVDFTFYNEKPQLHGNYKKETNSMAPQPYSMVPQSYSMVPQPYSTVLQPCSTPFSLHDSSFMSGDSTESPIQEVEPSASPVNQATIPGCSSMNRPNHASRNILIVTIILEGLSPSNQRVWKNRNCYISFSNVYFCRIPKHLMINTKLRQLLKFKLHKTVHKLALRQKLFYGNQVVDQWYYEKGAVLSGKLVTWETIMRRSSGHNTIFIDTEAVDEAVMMIEFYDGETLLRRYQLRVAFE